jgi:hypothetical protein
MSLAGVGVDGPVVAAAVVIPSLPVPDWHPDLPPPAEGTIERTTAARVGVARQWQRLGDTLFLAGVLALIFALALFLYMSDPVFHHDANQVWTSLGVVLAE